MILIWLAALVVVLDQLTKYIVVAMMTEGQSIPVIPNIFHLTYILNPGAAFGMFAHSRTFFIGVALLVLLIVWWFRKEILAEPLCVRAGTALFIGGAVGNLIDRSVNGMVVDFFDFRIWPIFNVADIAICVGVGLIIWNLIQTEITVGDIIKRLMEDYEVSEEECTSAVIKFLQKMKELDFIY